MITQEAFPSLELPAAIDSVLLHPLSTLDATWCP